MSNHRYNTPSEGATDWHVPLNENFRRLNADVEIRDREANRDGYEPAAGAKFLATDTGNRYVGDGSTWTRLPAPRRLAPQRTSVGDRFRLPTRSSDPGDAAVGELWMREDLGTLRVMTPDGPVDVAPGGDSGGSDGGSDYLAHVHFQDDSYLDWFPNAYRTEYNSIVGSADAYDSAGLRVAMPAGEQYGTDMQFPFAENGFSEPEELYVRYYLKFDSSFQMNDDGKLPGPAGTYDSAGWGGRTSDGTNGWSARGGMSEEDGGVRLAYYCYHADMGSWGDWFRWDENGVGPLQRDRWYRIDQQVKMNTPGAYDGILRGWVDGTLAMERTDLRFRDSGHDDIKVESFWVNVYHGGGNTTPTDTAVYLDELTLSESPIA